MKKLFSFILLSAAMMVSGSAWATDAPEPLTFTYNGTNAYPIILFNNAFSYGIYPNLEYSVDGVTWTSIAEGDWQSNQLLPNDIKFAVVGLLTDKQSIQFRGTNANGFGGSYDETETSVKYYSSLMFKFNSVYVYYFVQMMKGTQPVGSISVSGNIMSIINIDNYDVEIPHDQYDITVDDTQKTATPCAFYKIFSECDQLAHAGALDIPANQLYENCYNMMFDNCSSLTTGPVLPAKNLAPGCYQKMFLKCTKLSSAPALPATTMASSCYQGMFGDCISLTEAPALPATTLEAYCYNGMFSGCTGLTEAPALPATTLEAYCYDGMFTGCTGLTEAPALPATALATSCYSSMFSGCTGLTEAPALLATTLASSCYSAMFGWCSKLSEAPALPATTLATSCYSNMFTKCTSLTSAPELPATTLATYCYFKMFYGCNGLTKAPSVLPATEIPEHCYNKMFYECTSLEVAPELPATKLAKGCYQDMFYGCTNLHYIKCLATELQEVNLTPNWVYNVAETGTFVKYPNIAWGTGQSAIPSGWTTKSIPQLSDEANYSYETSKDESSAIIKRTFNHNGTNHTICLPFDLSESQFASSPLGAGCSKLLTFGSAAIVGETLEITMVDVTPKAIVAGQPYIIAWENDNKNVVNPLFNGIEFQDILGGSIARGNVTFHGLLGPESVTADDASVLFVGASGNLSWPSKGGSIKGYRCYFKANTGGSSPIRRGMTAVLAEGRNTPTGMNQVTGDRLQVTDVEKLIEQGRVVIISDGVRYNLNGQIIK